MENMNEVSEKGMLNDTVGLKVSTLRTWLEDFRRTHYKNRPLTDHFWNVIYFSQKLGVNVKGVLGQEIWNHLKEMKPGPFMVYLHPVFHDKDPKMNNYKPFLVELE
jgi:hypothetical protein